MRVSALILAGGYSRRMGSDKALLPWQGIPMLVRVGRVAAQCCIQVFVLTPWPQRYQSLMEPRWFLVPESQPGRGPLWALAEGMETLQAMVDPPDWILVLACDLPQLKAEVLQTWLGELEGIPDEVMGLIPRTSQGWEPLCGLYRLTAVTQLQVFLGQGGRSFQGWLEQLSVQAIPVDPQLSGMLYNCNTPSDRVPDRFTDRFTDQEPIPAEGDINVLFPP